MAVKDAKNEPRDKCVLTNSGRHGGNLLTVTDRLTGLEVTVCEKHKATFKF